LEEAVQWYDAQLAGLGDKLLEEVDSAAVLIERFPMAWHPLSKRARSHRLNRFPYSLIYRISISGDLTVVAFAHQQRKPLYWRDRLNTL
jgi:ParE toxin of type II toxin-antitoxin system, parDE